MEYTEVRYSLSGKSDNAEYIIAVLGELGFESFVEEENQILAYIQSDLFNEKNLLENDMWNDSVDTSNFSWKVIAERNWNEEWEKNFNPVTINGCHIRAPFHESKPNAEYEIIIEPKMSFGTAHHETTALMIKYILETDFTDKTVLDMGSGTGVLAILAGMRGGKELVAIDTDEWAYLNSIENFERNNINNVSVYQGDASLLNNQYFDIILANINRNILLNDIHTYSKCLNSGGLLFLSGFYTNDLDAIKACCELHDLAFLSNKEDNNWVAACFIKKAN